jgi:hypothetical protein
MACIFIYSSKELCPETPGRPANVRKRNMRKTERPRSEVADILERFVQGISPKWEWDDFCSFPIVNPYLEKMRLRAAGLSQEYPPAQKGHYCSEAGLEVLRRMIGELRQPGEPGPTPE